MADAGVGTAVHLWWLLNAAAWWLSAWLAADLLTGAVHWIEDRYGDPDWPVLGPHVIRPNILHHRDQTAFLAGGWLWRNWTALLPAWTAAVVLAWCGCWWAAAVAGFAGLGNEVHAWSHRRCSRGVRALQLAGLLASPEDHQRHHRRPFSTDFCVMSGLLNPLLRAVDFWPRAEAIVGIVLGVWPREERTEA